MLHKLIKSVLFPLSIMPLIGSCSIFEPKQKVIEYDEEVKLSDGSMIWVHIKRHYTFSSAPGQGSGYLPGIVEISWDTGFPNVGRKSVFFNNGVVLIDKIDDVWYVVGGKPSFSGAYKNSKAVNCKDVSTLIHNGRTCFYILNPNGETLQNMSSADDFAKSIKVNILTLTGLDDWVHNTNQLPNSKLTWNSKVKLNSTKGNSRQSLEKPYAEF